MKIGFWVFETCSKRGPFTDIRVAPFQFEENKLQDLTDESSNISENWFLCKKEWMIHDIVLDSEPSGPNYFA